MLNINNVSLNFVYAPLIQKFSIFSFYITFLECNFYFSDGPKSVHFSLYPTEEDIHLCEDIQKKKKKIIQYECSVSADDVYPSLSIEIRQNNAILKNSTKIYNVTDTTTLETGGGYNFSCFARNSEFGNVYVSQILAKNVIGI